MKNRIEIIKKVRAFLLEGIKDLSAEQLNKIPAGFNNNIIWNLGHIVAAQQGICYKRAGLPSMITDEFWEKYRSGSKPDGIIDEAEIDYIKELFFTSLDQLEADYDKNIFTGYTSWATRYGVEIGNIDDALSFVPFHEGLHSGVIGAMKRLV
jgi:hypothetical protein